MVAAASATQGLQLVSEAPPPTLRPEMGAKVVMEASSDIELPHIYEDPCCPTLYVLYSGRH